MSTLHQLTCPSCHAPLHEANVGDLFVTCRYCGTKFVNDNTSNGKISADAVLPVKTTEEGFRKAAYNEMLVNAESIPLDFLSSSVFDKADIKLFYVPFYYFAGSMRGSWSCQRVNYVDEYYRDRNGNTCSRSVPQYSSDSGFVNDNFIYIFCATDGKDEKVNKFINANDSNLQKAIKASHQKSRAAVPKDAVILDTLNPHNVWNRDGAGLIDAHCRMMGEKQAQSRSGKIEGFSSSSSADFSHQDLYYLPVYVMTVRYKGKEYALLKDAIFGFEYANLPVDETWEEKKNRVNAEKESLLSKHNPWNCWQPILFVVAFYAVLYFAHDKAGWAYTIATASCAVLFLSEEAKYRSHHIVPFLVTVASFVIIGLLFDGPGFWGALASVVIGELFALPYYSDQCTINETQDKAVTEKYDGIMDKLKEDRRSRRRTKVKTLK